MKISILIHPNTTIFKVTKTPTILSLLSIICHCFPNGLQTANNGIWNSRDIILMTEDFVLVN